MLLRVKWRMAVAWLFATSRLYWFSTGVESEISCRQTVEPEYGQLKRLQTVESEYGQLKKLQLHLFPIFVEDCLQLDRKTSMWSLRLGSASNTKPSNRLASNVPASVERSQPNFFFFFFSAGLLLHKKVSDWVQYLPSDLECCYTRKQHKHQAFSLNNLLITPLAREILEWRHELYSTQI